MATEKPEYKGPDETVVALGQSAYDGYVGSAVGAAAGAAAGAVLHDAKKSEEIALADKTLHEAKAGKYAHSKAGKVAGGIAKEEKAISKISPEAIETAERVMKENGFIKQLWHGMGRGGKALAGAAIGALAIGSIAQMTGLVRGQKKAQAGKKQFEDLVTENAVLQEKLETTSAQLAESKSFVASLQAERNRPHSQEAQR